MHWEVTAWGQLARQHLLSSSPQASRTLSILILPQECQYLWFGLLQLISERGEINCPMTLEGEVGVEFMYFSNLCSHSAWELLSDSPHIPPLPPTIFLPSSLHHPSAHTPSQGDLPSALGFPGLCLFLCFVSFWNLLFCFSRVGLDRGSRQPMLAYHLSRNQKSQLTHPSWFTYSQINNCSRRMSLSKYQSHKRTLILFEPCAP